MVAVSFFARFRAAGAALAALAGLVGSNPAFANSAAAADIMAPVRAAQGNRVADSAGDQEFRRLFASWQSLDGSEAAEVRSAGTVSIPSLMPVDGVRFTSGFGMRTHPVLGGRRAHRGIDLAGATGTPIRATADGTVARAEWFSSYGLYVQLEHGGAIETRYGHMSRLNVAPGQSVRKGDVIGYVGTTGRSTGPHLHYEVRVAGEAVNPVPYLREEQVVAAAANHDPAATGMGGE